MESLQDITKMLRQNVDSNDKQALQWIQQHNRNRGRVKNTWGRDLEKEMETAVFKFSWRKMEMTAQDRAGWRK